MAQAADIFSAPQDEVVDTPTILPPYMVTEPGVGTGTVFDMFGPPTLVPAGTATWNPGIDLGTLTSGKTISTRPVAKPMQSAMDTSHSLPVDTQKLAPRPTSRAAASRLVPAP